SAQVRSRSSCQSIRLRLIFSVRREEARPNGFTHVAGWSFSAVQSNDTYGAVKMEPSTLRRTAERATFGQIETCFCCRAPFARTGHRQHDDHPRAASAHRIDNRIDS